MISATHNKTCSLLPDGFLPQPSNKGHQRSEFICLLVEEDDVLRTEADGLTDLVDGGPDVEAVDLGRSGGRRKHPGQDGAEI